MSGPRWIAALEAQLFPHPSYMDRYRSSARRYAARGMVVLHLGGGRDQSRVACILPDARVLCVDIDHEAVKEHPADWRIIADAARLPLKSASCNLVLCEHVFEHLTEPTAVIGEIARVLRLGGRMLFTTPNRYGYVALLGRLTPHRWHAWWNRKRGVADQDTFPTAYRLNTVRAIDRECIRAGLKREWAEMMEWAPIYLRPIPAAYVVGMLVFAVIARIRAARPLWTSIVGCYRKEPCSPGVGLVSAPPVGLKGAGRMRQDEVQ